MSDNLFIIALVLLAVSICFDIWRVNQFKKYLEQNKIILSQMTLKVAQLREISIVLKRIEEINETINNTDI